MNTTILPTPPTSGAIVTGDYGYDNALAELITNNNVAETSREILAAIGAGNASIIANAGVHSVAGLNATNLASVSNLKATGDASVAALKATGDSTVAINKATYDGVVSNMNATNLTSVATQKAISDSALANALSAGEVRELINKAAFDNNVAIKENGFAIREEGCKTRETVLVDGCKTRETVNERFYALNTEMLKGFADNKYEALKNKCELEKQIAEICCCVEKDGNITRSLVLSENTKRLESELQEARLKAAIAGLGKCERRD